jgi:CheY-like chemotaxis protein
VREPDGPASAGDATAQPEPPDKLVSDVEHELNNSLAAIIGFSQVIRRDPSLPQGLRHNADLLVEEATRTRRIVQGLLEIARQGPPEGATSAEVSPTASITTSPPRVLVLEDEPSIRVFLEKALALLGYEPVITSLGPDAIELAVAGDHAALLFDHRIAGMSGTEAYEAVVALRPELADRVVMMSGDLLDPGLEALAAAHPVTLMGKPFDIDTLDRTIRAVMEATGQVRG